MFSEKILKYELSKIPGSVFRNLSSLEVSNMLEEEIENYVKFISDEVAAKNYMDTIVHQNRNVEDYKIHVLEFEDGNIVMSGINFSKTGDKFIPFVEIYHKNFDIPGREQSDGFMRKIYERYKIFDPTGISFFEICENGLANENDVVSRTQLMAGHINSLRKLDKPERYDDIILEQAQDLDFYERYVEEYEFLKSENDIYQNEVVAESTRSLNNALNKGYIYKVKIDGKLAGILAATKRNMKHLCGYYIIEEILYRDFRKQNFGPAVQRKMIDTIESKDNEFIYGTISALNPASLKTAQKCGRTIAGTFFYKTFNNTNTYE